MTRIDVAASADVRENELLAARADGIAVLLTRVGGRAYAIENKCAHLGWSMARGSIQGATLQCPWHGAKYDVCTGRSLDWVNGVVGMSLPQWTHRLIALGKGPAPVRTFAIFEEGGRVFVELPG